MKKMYLLLVVFVSIVGFGQTGVLDVGFGNGGKAWLKVDSLSQLNQVEMQSDGKIVALSWYRKLNIVRFNTNGTPDSTFGNAGVVTKDTSNASYWGRMVLQPDNKIVLASSNGYDFQLLRFKLNGTLDSSFGINGRTLTPTIYSSSDNNRIEAMVRKPDGKIVIAFQVYLSTTIPKWTGWLAQFKADGSPDSSFGQNGFKQYALPAREVNMFGALAASLDNKIFVGGRQWIDSNGTSSHSAERFVLLKVKENGEPDSSFGVNGYAKTFYKYFVFDELHSFAIDAQGKIYGVGQTNRTPSYNLCIMRFSSNGFIDSTFGTNGRIVTTNNDMYGIDAYVQPNGKLMVAASKWFVPRTQYYLLRYDTTGRPDSSFGIRGMVVTNFGTGKSGAPASMAVQNDGKIIVGGIGTTTAVPGKFNLLVQYNANLQIYYNTINLSAFIDYNANAVKDAGEPYFDQLKTKTYRQGAVDTIFSFSSTGRMMIDTDKGTYKTSIVIPPAFNAMPATPHISMFPTYFNNDSYTIALQPKPGINRDLRITLIQLNPVNPGSGVVYKLIYKNNGSDTVPSGIVKFVKENRSTCFYKYPAPSSIVGDTIIWSFSNLEPGDTATIIVMCTTNTPPSVNVGNEFCVSADILPVAGDLTPLDNHIHHCVVVTGSVDPNDKTETHAGKITKNQVATGDYLTYTIRFQNTGNDTAFNVYIHDTLSDKVDLNTFEMLTSSANYQMTLNDGKCVWSFNNINLVDSIKNEPLSHGYLVYRIKPKSTVQTGDLIMNTAYIYFDYNLPVKTNTDSTTVVADILPLKLLVFTAKKEGKTNRLQWSTTNEVNVDRFEVERSAEGREYVRMQNVKCKMQNGSSYNFTDHSPLTTHNYYRLKMVDKDGRFEYSPVRMVNNSGSFLVTVYPNPAKDKLQVMVESDKNTTLQVQVVAQDGKMLISQQWNVKEGAAKQTLKVSTLQNGSYFLKMTSGDKDQIVVKFEKL